MPSFEALVRGVVASADNVNCANRNVTWALCWMMRLGKPGSLTSSCSGDTVAAWDMAEAVIFGRAGGLS